MSGREVKPIFRHGKWNDASGYRLEHTVRKMMATLERRMLVTGQKFGRWTRSFSDGTRIIISANLNGPSPVFHANVIPGPSEVAEVVTEYYLESGIVAFENFTSCAVGGDEGELYFNTTLSSWYSSRTGLSLFSYIGTFNTPELLDFSTYPPLPSTTGSTDQPAGTSQAFACNRFQYKDDANAIPASIFSGKYTRMLVQGKYGRRDTVITSTGSTQAIQIDNRVLSSSASSTHAIYVYEEGSVLEYWLMNIAVGTLTVGKLSFPAWADVMIAGILSEGITGTDRDWLEAWILAYAEWPTEEIEVETGLPTINPLSYGWRFKSDGTQAKAVTVTGSLLNGYTMTTDTVDISLTYLAGEPSWTATGSTSTNATDINFSNLCMLWALNGDAGYTPLASSNPDAYSNVPVFGWYTEADVWATEGLSSDDSSGSAPIDVNTRNVCNLTWSGESFKGAKNYSSFSQFSSAPAFAGTYSYSSTSGNPTPYGTLSGGSSEPEAKSGYRSVAMHTDYCGDKPDEPECPDPPDNRRYKRQGFKEVLQQNPQFVSGSYAGYNFLAPARGDCNKCYVGAVTHLPTATVSVVSYRRRKYYAYTDYECFDPDVGDWVSDGYTWNGATTAKSAWQVVGGSARTSGSHDLREIQVRLVGDNGSQLVYADSGTTGTPETQNYQVSSSMGGSTIDLRNSHDDGGWDSYFTVTPIVVSSLFVKQSAVQRSLAYVPNPGEDYTFEDGTWGIPSTDQWLYVGGS